MPFKHILVPYDKSEAARHALEQAVEMAKKDADIRIDVITVFEMPPLDLPISHTGDFVEPEPIPLSIKEIAQMRDEAFEAERDKILGSAHDVYRGIETQVSVKVIPGISPMRGIVDYASENGCDLIIMGNRGLGTIRSMLGSVSYGVVRNSDIPVMIVK